MSKKLLMTASTWSHIRNFHLPYLHQFRRLGWETHVGCRGVPEHSPEIDRLIELPFEKKMSAPDNLSAALRVRALVKAERYDLIITHTSLAAFFTRRALKGQRERPRLVNVVHGYLFDDETPAVKREVLLNAEKLTAPETDLLLTMNRYDALLTQKLRLARESAFIPGVGVDFSRLERAAAADGAAVRRALDIPPEAFVLLYAAEFSARKSQRVLIEAMTRLPRSTVLVLCGTGDARQDCIDLAREKGLTERVRFPGQIAEMSAWYRMADAAVSASRIEGLPFNVMESMYMGLPVVASAVKGNSDLVQDGVTGLLYPYGDADACAACIRRLETDGALREALAARACERVRRYSLEAVLPKVMDRYLSCARVAAETAGAV